MVRPRRSLRSNEHVEEDENELVQKTCSVCKKLFKQSQEKAGIIYEGSHNLNPDLKEKPQFICDDCVQNSTDQESNIPSDNRENISRLLKTFGVLGIIVLVFAIYMKYHAAEKTFEVRMQNQTQNEKNFDAELYGLEDVYKQQEEKTWFTFAAGIKSVLAEKPYKPSVFLLLYDDDHAGKTVECIARDVTKAASKYLMNKEIPPIIYAGADLNKNRIINDPGKLLEDLKKPITENGALIVTNLEDVHPEVAATFHYFCDRYSPLVEKAVYFFTLKFKGDSQTVLQKVAEDTLKSLWDKHLPDNKLYPLITRMTGNVMKIFNDYGNC